MLYHQLDTSFKSLKGKGFMDILSHNIFLKISPMMPFGPPNLAQGAFSKKYDIGFVEGIVIHIISNLFIIIGFLPWAYVSGAREYIEAPIPKYIIDVFFVAYSYVLTVIMFKNLNMKCDSNKKGLNAKRI